MKAKRLILIFLLGAGLMHVASPVFAQGRVAKWVRALRGWRAAQTVSPLLGAASEQSAVQLSGSIGRQVAAESALATSVISPTREFVPVHPDLWKPLDPRMAPYARSVFRARPLESQNGNTFSGVVFKTTYEGKEEIFGVVAAHVLASSPTTTLLGAEFIAEIFDKDGFIAVPVKLVQVSPSQTMDVALAKFRPEDEELLTPLTLASREVSNDEKVAGLGFGEGKWVFTPNRQLLRNTLFSLRTSFALPLADRPGLCGSALLNEQNELLGIHTGSTHNAEWRQSLGYATHAKFLNLLVEAYHNGGRATLPFYLGGQQIASLGVDEFVSFVRLKNEKGRTIWKRAVGEKFPYNEITEVLPQARYIELSVSRAIWTGRYLDEDYLVFRSVEYDLLEHRTLKGGS